MAALGMEGIFSLNAESIEKNVTQISAGNYALGHVKDKKFYVKYVGRSDSDVNGRLKQHVGKYKEFKYSYAKSAKAAFEKECQNFHDFGGEKYLDNKIHPDRPKDSGWKCPLCKVFN